MHIPRYRLEILLAQESLVARGLPFLCRQTFFILKCIKSSWYTIISCPPNVYIRGMIDSNYEIIIVVELAVRLFHGDDGIAWD